MFDRSPDLKIDVTLPFFDIWGKVEELSDRLKIWVSDGAMTAAASFNSRAVIRSGPVDLFVFIFDKFLRTDVI
jgi:hypothetical protein